MAAIKTELLTSDKNTLLKEIRRAAVKGTVTEDGYAVAESFHLLEEALRSDCRIRAIVASESVLSAVESHVRGLSGIRVISVSETLFQKISGTETSQGVIALVRPPAWRLEQLFRARPMVVVLDGVQDPGNAGTIIRTAEAFGASGVIFLRGSVNPYNPKALRAAAGSTFRVPMVYGADVDLVRAALEQNRVEMFAAVPRAGKSLAECDLTGRIGFAIGSEGRGISERLSSMALGVRIPTVKVESLNAAMAAGILLYEAARQRFLPAE